MTKDARDFVGGSRLIAASSVDQFLRMAEEVLGKPVAPRDIELTHDEVVSLNYGEELVTIRREFPDGTVVEIKRLRNRRTLIWKRSWPYVLIALSAATALILAWRSKQIIDIIQFLIDKFSL